MWRVHHQPAAGHAQTLAGLEIDFAEGQAYQTQLLQRWLDNGEAIGGWKIGMTSGASRNAMGAGIRPFGYVLASRIRHSGDTLPLADLHRGQVENELCFVLGKTLGADAGTAVTPDTTPAITPEMARAAVAGVLPAFEVNQKRLPSDVSAGVRVADNLSNWGIVIGSPVAPLDDLSQLTVTLSNADGAMESVASAGHIDDHYQSLATLAQTLAQFGHCLQAGEYVITGAYAKTPFAPGSYSGHFDQGIGTVAVNLR